MKKSYSEAYYKHGGNLALYRSIGEMKDYWEEVWQGDFRTLLISARSGYLGEFEYPFSKYLPQKSIILEAGCGRGKYVCALQSRGYLVEGIDYATETVSLVQKYAPDLNIRQGDIKAIDRPDNYYSAYISIGVLEHDFNGPQTGLAEAYRTLNSGGIALISVPYLNWPRRRLWLTLPEAESAELTTSLRFYQDHVDINSFYELLTTAGFKVLELYPYGLYGGLVRDWRFGRWLNNNNFLYWRLGRLVRRICARAPFWLRRDLSHMMMFVCQK